MKVATNGKMDSNFNKQIPPSSIAPLPKQKTEPHLSSCLCFNLRVGCQIIGWFRMIVGFGLFGLGMYFFVEYNRDLDSSSQVLAIIFTVASLIDIAFNSVLLVGVYRKSDKFLKTYVYLSIAGIVLAAINLFKVVLHAQFPVSHLIGIALAIYFTLVVDSYATELKNGPPSATNDVNMLL